MRFGIHEKKIIQGMLPKFAELRIKDPRVRVIPFPELKDRLNTKEQNFLGQFLLLDPRIYGFRGERYGLPRAPKDLITIEAESASGNGAVITRGVHYLPKNVHDAYCVMNRAMLRDIGRRVFVESGYRSPAYQCVLFLEYLAEDDFDIKKTVKRVAFPGYSEHGAPLSQAIDFITEDREDNSTANPVFEKTKEYQWLYTHAPEYGFLLSYPRGNEWGVAFEPWHWHYDAQLIAPPLLPRKKAVKDKGITQYNQHDIDEWHLSRGTGTNNAQII